MSGKTGENNWVDVVGVIVSDFYYSHEVMGERFYTTYLSVARLSGNTDIVPLLISERLIDVKKNFCGRTVEATGQFRSYSRHDGIKSRLLLSVFTKQLIILEGRPDVSGSNQIYLNGYICKEPVYRITPFGREIVDLFLAVNRSYGKSDYIPCIAWGSNARSAASLKVSTQLEVWGRIQSREYNKKISEDEIVKRTAYEVSVHRLQCSINPVDNSSV